MACFFRLLLTAEGFHIPMYSRVKIAGPGCAVGLSLLRNLVEGFHIPMYSRVKIAGPGCAVGLSLLRNLKALLFVPQQRKAHHFRGGPAALSDRGGIQTPNPQSRNLMRYSVAPRGQN